MGSAARVFEFIDLKPTIPLTGGIVLEGLQGTIEFSHVSFTYPTRPDQKVLSDFTLTVPRGKMVALCGASGSGKSTIGYLLERFYDPDSGSIKVDGIPLDVIDPSWLRRQIGYINQEPVLFATSIRENIRYGRPDATEEDVISAAQKANAHAFIEGFPEGYETLVGERGVTMSGGQRQRIAIARAILKNPSILILDEATSALDTQSEKLVQDALEKLMGGRTVLVIAHRLSTIQNADVIVVMSKGNILEVGTHKELMKKKARYFSLYNQLAENV
jgi:ATP-binding cassette subfamily B (MDR/TAP) protein 8